MDEKLQDYFKNKWKPNYDKFIYSGWELVKKIKPYETILDVGCGYNLFKQYFGGRLYGIDPSNNFADEVISIENYNSDKLWDVAFCLGSINFGNEDTVFPQVEKVCKITKRIYWRQNPGICDHPHEDAKNISFFPWNFELNYQWAEKNNFYVSDIKWDYGNRIYAEWIAK